MPSGLFGPSDDEPRKRKPAKAKKVSAPPIDLAPKTQPAELGPNGIACRRTLFDGTLCQRPGQRGATYLVPCRDIDGSWALVLPCDHCAPAAKRLAPPASKWVGTKRSDLEPFYLFLAREWPQVIKDKLSSLNKKEKKR